MLGVWLHGRADGAVWIAFALHCTLAMAISEETVVTEASRLTQLLVLQTGRVVETVGQTHVFTLRLVGHADLVMRVVSALKWSGWQKDNNKENPEILTNIVCRINDRSKVKNGNSRPSLPPPPALWKVLINLSEKSYTTMCQRWLTL